MLNQLKKQSTTYACSVFAFINVIKYDYGVDVPIGIILKLLIYLEKIGAFFRWEGAYAKVIFPATVKYINFKLKINLKLGVKKLKDIDNLHSYILGFKKSNKLYIDLAKDKEITKSDIDKIKKSKGGYGHFHTWKKGVILESLGGFPYKLSKTNLKYAYSLDLYYSNIRYVYGEEDIRQRLIKIVKARKKAGLYKIDKDGNKTYNIQYLELRYFL